MRFLKLQISLSFKKSGFQPKKFTLLIVAVSHERMLKCELCSTLGTELLNFRTR
jgi:hypothetical protein